MNVKQCNGRVLSFSLVWNDELEVMKILRTKKRCCVIALDIVIFERWSS